MLEAERAGAKALVVFMGSYSRNSEEWKVLRRIQADARCRPREVLAARREPGVDPEAADRVLRRLDLPTVLLD